MREGTNVCLDCGLVLSDKIFYEASFLENLNASNIQLKFDVENKISCATKNTIQNVLDKIHISTIYTDEIFQFLLSHCDDMKLPTIMFAIYKILNKNQVAITLKELSSISTIPPTVMTKVQKPNQNVKLKYVDIIEKYASLLNLPYSIKVEMKDKVNKLPNTGHNPCSLIAAVIYSVCKEHSLGVSMKKIANLMQVSCISIQRYLKILIKNDHS